MKSKHDANGQFSAEFHKAFGERLRALRKKRGYTINEMCEKLNKPRSTYSSWELGKRIPLGKSITSLSSILDTSVSYLMLDTDELNPITFIQESADLKKMLETDKVKIVWDGEELSDDKIKAINLFLESLNKK